MKRDFRIIGVRRKEVDVEKLALAFLMLARNLHEQDEATTVNVSTDPEAVNEAA